MDEFEAVYEKELVPILLHKHDLVKASKPDRVEVEGIFSRLFELASPSEIAVREQALHKDQAWWEALRHLGTIFGTTFAATHPEGDTYYYCGYFTAGMVAEMAPLLRYQFGLYSAPVGTGRTVESVGGLRNGAWQDLSILEGLPESVISNILEDREGHVWFATRGGGVCRYDGAEFVSFAEEDGLAGNDVSALLEDRTGRLWFGTHKGACCYNGEEFVTYTTEDGLAENYVSSLLEDRAGHLWLGTFGGGASRYDGRTFTTFTTADGLAENNIRPIQQDRQGRVWFGTKESGVSCFDGRRFFTLTTRDGLAHDRVNAILEDRHGHLWFGCGAHEVTGSGGLSRYDGKELTTFTTEDGLGFNEVWDIVEDRQGIMWFATLGGGVSRYDGEGFNPLTLECPAAYDEQGALVTDTCDIDPVLEITGTVDAATPGTYLVTYTATDDSDNETVVIRTIEVADTTPPEITLNGADPVILECFVDLYGELGAVISDACDPSPSLVIDASAVNTDVVGDYLVTYTGTDNKGNTASVTRTVSVVDTTLPEITLIGDDPLVLECPLPYTEPGADVVDICDASPVLTLTGSVDVQTVGLYTITYTAVDASDNTTVAERTVEVVDTTSPVITLVGDHPTYLELGTPYPEAGATATDDCDQDLPEVSASGSVDPSTAGTYEIAYDVSDASANTAETVTRAVVVLLTPNSYGLIATNSMHLKAHSTVHSGRVGVVDYGGKPTVAGKKYDLLIGSQAVTATAVTLSAPRISVKDKAEVEGTLVFTELKAGKKASIAFEEEVGPDHWPLFTECGLPPFRYAVAGDTDIKVKKNKTVELHDIDGPFGEIKVDSKGLLILSGGEYHLQKLDVGSKAVVLVRAPTTLLTADKFDLHSKAAFGPENGDVDASDIIIYVTGDDGKKKKKEDDKVREVVKIGDKASFVGNAYAPGGEIHLKNHSRSAGSFIGKNLILGDHAEVFAQTAWRTPGIIFEPPPPVPFAAKVLAGGNGGAFTPVASVLLFNYPNPFNPTTTLRYNLAEAGEVHLTIYNTLGQQVRSLVDELQPAGYYSITWDGKDQQGRDAATGVYIYRLIAGELFEARKLTLIR